MEGQYTREIWETVDHPKSKTVLGTRLVFNRAMNTDGQIEEYKCRVIAQGFRQIPGIHYQASSSLTPAQFSIGIALALRATHNWEGHQLDMEMAYLEVDVEEKNYFELLDGYRFPRIKVGDLTRPCTA